jgi:signal transduction histidine kinase
MMTAQKDDFYTDLISVVAHDLKTPISAVKGFIELVQQIGPLSDQQQHFSERALLSLERMERLIANLLEYARIDTSTELHLSNCDLPALIHEALELLEGAAIQRQIQIHVNVDESLPHIKADVRLLSQVVNNLIGNAIKYNRDGGQVWIRAADEQAFVRVDVQDTGVGIAEGDQQRVFERFFRSKSSTHKKVEGTGLGLTIAEMVIQKHGGHIWVESVPGEGSTFSFTLPRVSVHPGEAAVPGSRRESAYEFVPSDASAEEMDAVDDDSQETPEPRETDSKSDAI